MQSTSLEAYESIEPHLGDIQKVCLHEIIASGTIGMTQQELEDKFLMIASTIRTRVSELCRLGYVVDSGRKRKTRSGRNAIVWISRMFNV